MDNCHTWWGTAIWPKGEVNSPAETLEPGLSQYLQGQTLK